MDRMKTLYERLSDDNRAIIDLPDNYMRKAYLQGQFAWGDLTLSDAMSIYYILAEGCFEYDKFTDLFCNN